MNNKIFFIHIPKCGGTTLESILYKNYSKEKIYSVDENFKYRQNIIRYRALPSNEKEKFEIVSGHMGYGLHNYLEKKEEASYITMLRNPFDRICSHYYFVLRQPKHYLYDAVVRGKMSIDEYVQSKLSSELNNGQTRLLSSDNGFDLDFKLKKTLDRNDLRRAKTHLKNNFLFVGIMENFDLSLIILKHLLDLKSIYYYKKNVNKKNDYKQFISNETFKLIEENNSLDLELYNFATEIFENYYKNHPQYLDALNIFIKKNRIYSRIFGLTNIVRSGLKKSIRNFIH
jgi:hypothetical protein